MWCSNCHQDVPALSRAGTTSSSARAASDAAGRRTRSASAKTASRWMTPQRSRSSTAAAARWPTTGNSAAARASSIASCDAVPRSARSLRRSASIRRRICSTTWPRKPPRRSSTRAATSDHRRRPRARPPGAGQFVAWLVALVGAHVAGRRARPHRLVACRGSWSIGTWRSAWRSAAKGSYLRPGAGRFAPVAQQPLCDRQTAGSSRPLGQLQHTADALTAMRPAAAPAFYADLVRGASPQMLLTNLKGPARPAATRLNGQFVARPVQLSTRCAISSTTSALFTRHCSSESRSRIVTVLSCSVWPSTVMQNGVPASSWRR